MAFPLLQELAAARNSNNLFDAIIVYIERKIQAHFHFASVLNTLWEILYNRVNEQKMLIAELIMFGGTLALQCVEFCKQSSKADVIQMLEIRKVIGEVHVEVHKLIDFVTLIRFY